MNEYRFHFVFNRENGQLHIYSESIFSDNVPDDLIDELLSRDNVDGVRLHSLEQRIEGIWKVI